MVIDHPPVRGFANIVARGGQMLIQKFVTKEPIEALDVGVVVRLTSMDVLNRRVLRICQDELQGN